MQQIGKRPKLGRTCKLCIGLAKFSVLVIGKSFASVAFGSLAADFALAARRRSASKKSCLSIIVYSESSSLSTRSVEGTSLLPLFSRRISLNARARISLKYSTDSAGSHPVGALVYSIIS